MSEPAHILVVDDDANLRDVFARMLHGYRLSIAADGHEAMAILKREAVDLLITDYLMPGLTGTELIDIARAQGLTCPVLVITGYVHLLEQQQSTGWKHHPHLAKPLLQGVLRMEVARLLQSARQRS